MKKIPVLILAVVLIIGCFAAAGAEAAERFEDVWVRDGFAVTIDYDEGEFDCCMVQGDGSGESVVWEYGSCRYDAEKDALVCADWAYYREYWDETARKLVQADRHEGDSECAFMRIDGEKLIADDIPGLDETLELQRLSDAEEEDYLEAMEYMGRWVCDRAAVEVTEGDDGGWRFFITWGSSAREQAEWDYACAYYGEYRRMRAYEAASRIVTYGEDGEIVSSETVYTDGEAEFFLDEAGLLHWDDRVENAGEGMAFERVPE